MSKVVQNPLRGEGEAEKAGDEKVDASAGAKIIVVEDNSGPLKSDEEGLSWKKDTISHRQRNLIIGVLVALIVAVSIAIGAALGTRTSNETDTSGIGNDVTHPKKAPTYMYDSSNPKSYDSWDAGGVGISGGVDDYEEEDDPKDLADLEPTLYVNPRDGRIFSFNRNSMEIALLGSTGKNLDIPMSITMQHLNGTSVTFSSDERGDIKNMTFVASGGKHGLFEFEDAKDALLVTVKIPGETYGTVISLGSILHRKLEVDQTLSKHFDDFSSFEKHKKTKYSNRFLDRSDTGTVFDLGTIPITTKDKCSKGPLEPDILKVYVYQGGRSFPAAAQHFGPGVYIAYVPIEEALLAGDELAKYCRSLDFSKYDESCKVYGAISPSCLALCGNCAFAGPLAPICAEGCALGCITMANACLPSALSGGNTGKLCELVAEGAAAVQDTWAQDKVTILAYAFYPDGRIETGKLVFEPGDNHGPIEIEYTCKTECCGGKCCREGETCCEGKCGHCSEDPPCLCDHLRPVCCGSKCCKWWQKCCNGHCIPNGGCCPECKPGEYCCEAYRFFPGGSPYCCPKLGCCFCCFDTCCKDGEMCSPRLRAIGGKMEHVLPPICCPIHSPPCEVTNGGFDCCDGGCKTYLDTGEKECVPR